jgi:uncharacterized membrane protein (TIGR02234 family)
MRSKLWLLAAIALGGGLALYGATQTWVTLSLTEGAAAFGWLSITGQELNQSLSPIALAALAAALALTIAGAVFRRLLGALVVLLGVGIISIAATVLGDPVSAGLSRLDEATGLTGGAQLDLVTGSESSLFIVWTLASGAILAVCGVLVLVFGGRWKAAGRKYDSSAASAVVGGGTPSHVTDEPDRISDWESLNDGVDPSDTWDETR